MKIIRWILGITFLAYLTLLLSFYVFQDRAIFQRDSLAPDDVYTFDQAFEEYFIKMKDDVMLNALLFRTSQPSKGLILYFHGNSGNLRRWGRYAVDFTSLGYDILITDYRGYGKSTGIPGEDDFYEDAHTILEWAKANVPHTRLVIYGRSLGSAVASQLAIDAQPDLLILETPFDELMGTIYLPVRPIFKLFPLRHSFPNKTFLAKVTCKTVIFQGTDDWVVPLASAERLKPLLKEGDQFVIIEGGSHNDLRDFVLYHTTLAEALR